MANPPPDQETPEQAAEFLRLTLAKLAELKLPVSALNYALVYHYVSGSHAALNESLDEAFKQGQAPDAETMREYFTRYVCECETVNDAELRNELLLAVAQILGSIVDFAGKAALSNQSLESHLKELALAEDPKKILKIAADIIGETRNFVDATELVEGSIMETTMQIKSLKEELDQAREQANIDTLTGLYNRRGFDHALSDSIRTVEQESGSFCLLMLDIDYFKSVNDTHGHLVGDKVLRGISQLLVKQMRGNDYLSRFGGEAFAIILRDTPITGAFTAAENLRTMVERLKLKQVKSGRSLEQITISIGVACHRKGETDTSLIERCDHALYRAKELGRNRTIIAE